MGLIYQLTNVDCGTATLLNAILYLCGKDEITMDVVKKIVNTTSDIPDKEGLFSGGTSNEAMEYMAYWINEYGESHSFPVRAEKIEYEEAENELCGADYGKTCFVIKMYDAVLGCDHFYLVTGAERKGTETRVRVFDPYAGHEDPGIRDETYNRELSLDLFRFSRAKQFMLGTGEPLLIRFWRTKREATAVQGAGRLPRAKERIEERMEKTYKGRTEEA